MSHSDDRNYWGDHRVRAGERGDWYKSLDESRMKAVVILYGSDDEGDFDEEVEVPVKFEVCSTCDGKGHHVNPSIDAGGISAEQFHDDPDFAEEYFSGAYDVPCYGCGGRRVEAVLDRDRCDADTLKRLDAKWEDEAESRRERDAERRMGA